MSAKEVTIEVQYRTVPDYPGYRVGDDGSVWSSRGNGRSHNHPWRRLKPWVNGFGYPTVRLKNKAGYGNFFIHRLVLQCFIGQCPIGMNGAHNNGIRNDCRLVNLRWDTHANNCADKALHGTHQCGSRHGMAILCEADVPKVYEMTNCGMTSQEVGDELNVAAVTIQAILSRRLWSHVDRPHLRIASSEVQRSLIEKLISHGYSAENVGPLAGVSQPMVSMVRRGKRTMRLKHELKLQSAVELLFRPGQPG